MNINNIIHENSTFTGEGGIKLFSQSWRDSTQPIRGVLIILHGLKDHSSRYMELAIGAAGRGFVVYAFDMRGHGRSEGKKAYVGKFRWLIDDLATFTRIVRDKHPGKPVYIFGHSMGGTTVSLAVAKHQIDFQGIILSAAALVPGEGISNVLISITRFLGAVLPGLTLMKLPEAQFSRDPAVVREMAADPFILHRSGPVRTAAQLLSAMDQFKLNIEQFDKPVLILHGTADKLTNPLGSQQLAGAAKTADKTLKLYKGLVHDLVHEPEHEMVIKDIVDWLDERVTATV